METIQVNMHEAKSRLSELAELVVQGRRVVIAKAGQPYLDLLPHQPQRTTRSPGRLRGEIRMDADFDQTPEELLSDFEGN